MTLQQKQFYRELLNTIDFFSQKLHTEQIIKYGYEIFEDLTLPLAGAIYTLDEDETAYVARFSMGYKQLPDVAFSDIYNELARKNGFLLDRREIQERYFKNSFLDELCVEIILPLIVEDRLFGFIVAIENKKSSGIKNREFLNRFTDLLNLSLEKAESYQRAQSMKLEINKRKFNLDSFSQILKILMTALDQQYIQRICLDVIRELTSSSVTAIAMSVRQDYLAVSAYKDIVNNKECFLNISLIENATPKKIIYHIENDREALEEIFETPSDLKKLQAEYVVLLVKEKILGCISIGKPVSGQPYDQQLLEQIENLSSMMYIAINNAKQFKDLQLEQERMANQLAGMKHLNRSIEIMSHSDSLEEMCEHVMHTLNYGFGVEKAFMLIKQELSFVSASVEDGISFEPSEDIINFLDENHDGHVEYITPSNNPIVDESSNCFVRIPIVENSYEEKCIGCLVVHKISKALEETEVVIFETLIKSISPIIKQFLIVNTYKTSYEKRPEIALEELYEQYSQEASYFDLPIYIYGKKRKNLFVDRKDRSEISSNQVCIGSLEIIFSHDSIVEDGYISLDATTFENLKDEINRFQG